MASPQTHSTHSKHYERDLVGFYHEHGYNIWTRRKGVLEDQVYEAGNNPAESTSVVPVEDGEDLETLQRFCEQTGEDMAEERGLPWSGASREDDPYAEGNV